MCKSIYLHTIRKIIHLFHVKTIDIIILIYHNVPNRFIYLLLSLSSTSTIKGTNRHPGTCCSHRCWEPSWRPWAAWWSLLWVRAWRRVAGYCGWLSWQRRRWNEPRDRKALHPGKTQPTPPAKRREASCSLGFHLFAVIYCVYSSIWIYQTFITNTRK